LAKILQKRASRGRWRPNRKWKYGGDPIFRLSNTDILVGGCSFGTPERRWRDVEPYVVELSLLDYSRVSRDVTKPEVVYCGRL